MPTSNQDWHYGSRTSICSIISLTQAASWSHVMLIFILFWMSTRKKSLKLCLNTLKDILFYTYTVHCCSTSIHPLSAQFWCFSFCKALYKDPLWRWKTTRTGVFMNILLIKCYWGKCRIYLDIYFRWYSTAPRCHMLYRLAFVHALVPTYQIESLVVVHVPHTPPR